MYINTAQNYNRMYKHRDYTDEFVEYGKEKIKNMEIEEYGKYLKICEGFICNKRIILGGIAGIDALVENPINLNTFRYELYTYEPYRVAKTLVDLLYKETQNKFIYLQTNYIDHEYTIIVNDRYLIKIYANEAKLDLFEIMDTKFIKANFIDGKLTVLGPYIQLIDIYRTLYSPNKATDWVKYLQYEKKLYKQIKQYKFGGAKKKFKTEVRKDIIEQIRKIFNHDLVCLHQYSSCRIQFISENKIERDFKKLVNMLPNRHCKYVIQTLHIPGDDKIRRITIYIDEMPIADIFNSATYEVIPHKNGQANIFVSLRFLLIDIWTIIYIKNIGCIDEFYFTTQLQEKYCFLNKLFKQKKKMENPFKIWDFYGKYDTRLTLRKGGYVENYFPKLSL